VKKNENILKNLLQGRKGFSGITILRARPARETEKRKKEFDGRFLME
jgi:hypothetical protein